MSVELAPSRASGLRLRHRVLVAAGGAGYGRELLEAVGDQRPAAIITRSTTREARAGNPPPRMVAIRDGTLSSVGSPNPGLDAVLRRYGPDWGASDVPIIVSLCADTTEDIATMARSLEMQPAVAGVELNLACPDRSRRGAPTGLDVAASELATVAARAATDLPLIVKLPTSEGERLGVARAVAAAGADAISAIAPIASLALTADRKDAALGTTYGGLSGPTLRPLALRTVYELAQVVRIPIIGCGGISTLEDVLDFLAAGATAVAMATAALADPWLPGRLGAELDRWCQERGIDDMDELVGSALPARRGRSGLHRGPFSSRAPRP